MARVLKFGGSSVANATNMSRVLDIVGREIEKGPVVLISSAISACTDALLALAETGDRSVLDELRRRHAAIVRRLFTGAERAQMQAELDGLFAELIAAPADEKVCFGELFSTRILARKLASEGYRTRWLDARKLIIRGQRERSYAAIREAVLSEDAEVYVAPGFIASDPDGKVTTLGRGGSDYSAALFAAALSAESLQIWTDVPGIMTANPKWVPTARSIPQLSYQAAREMAEHGAKVLYAPTVAPAMDAGIAIQILNTFQPEHSGTCICAANSTNSGGWIGLASRSLSPTVVELYLVGNGEENGLRRLGDVLRRSGIAVLDLAPDRENVRVQVPASLEKEALQALHREFFEQRQPRSVEVFIAGYGAVGKALVRMIAATAPTVSKRTGKSLKIVGVGNTRCALFEPMGLRPDDLAASLEAAVSEEPFVERVLRQAPSGAIFVDCTDSQDLYLRYPALMAAGIHIVSSNRRSLAIPYAEYAALLQTARTSGVFLRYETTVGAALPVLGSVARGTNTCDEVLSIEAAVSCTLNQILGEYSEGRDSFASLLRKAQLSGLTEADPRLDLGGRDALRKLLILSREAGVPLEEQDVCVESLVPPGYAEGPLDDFYAALSAREADFERQFRRNDGLRPRFVASLTQDESAPLGYRASIEVRPVGPSHPAYAIRGTENAIIIRSSFHPYPLVISGAGEGAKQAASSILNDILR